MTKYHDWCFGSVYAQNTALLRRAIIAAQTPHIVAELRITYVFDASNALVLMTSFLSKLRNNIISTGALRGHRFSHSSALS